MKRYNLIAIATYPPILDIFIALIFILGAPAGLGVLSPFAAFLVSFVFVSAIPFAPFPYLYRRGSVDFNVSERHKRTVFFLVAIGGYTAAALLFLHFGALLMFYLVLSFALIAAAVMCINFSWKISTHAAGVAGPMTAIAFVFGWQFLALHALTILVMWSRLKLRVHTFRQVVAGAALSIAITLGVFVLFV